jgi:hypothetical protein
MSECLPNIPAGSTIRQNSDGSWQYQRRSVGPWLPMPAPQPVLPWRTDGPAVQSREPVSVAPEASPSPADCMALAVCRAGGYPGPCHVSEICNGCREKAAAVAHEIARQLRERYGSSATADWLDGVGCHTETSPSAA